MCRTYDDSRSTDIIRLKLPRVYKLIFVGTKHLVQEDLLVPMLEASFQQEAGNYYHSSETVDSKGDITAIL